MLSKDNGSASRPSLRTALIRSAVPAYLIPAVTTYLNAQFIPDQVIADRLAAASFTTIAVPSAIAAVLVTLWCHRRRPPARPTLRASLRAMAAAALVCASLAVAASMVLIANGLQTAAILQYTTSSAAIGGALTARRWARSGAQAGRRSTSPPAEGSGPRVVPAHHDVRLAADRGIRP